MKYEIRNLKLVWLLISYLTFHISFAQQNKIDSLVTLIKTDKEDTNKVIHLNALGWELKSSNLDTSIIVYYQAVSLATSIQNKATNSSEKRSAQKHIANALNNIGFSVYLKADYPTALENYLNALKIYEHIKDKKGMAKCYSNMGIVYYSQHDFAKALYYYSEALKKAEEIGNKQIQLNNIANIGLLYSDNGNYEKALEFYFKALNMAEQLGNKEVQASNLGNIGLLYSVQAKKIKSETERKELVDKALANYFKALKMAEEIDYKQLQANTLGNIGGAYTDTKQYVLAEKYLLDALKLNKEIAAMNEERQTEELLTELYIQTNRHQFALEHYKRAMVLKDSIFNEEKNKEMTRKEMTYDFEKKEAATKAEQNKKDTVTQIIIYSVSVGFALVLVLAVFIFRGYRQKQKANIIISEQKLLVEEKQKDILDSIHYAKRIQQSLLPTEKYIDKQLRRLKNKD